MEKIKNYEFIGAYKHKGYIIEIAQKRTRSGKEWEAYLTKPNCIYKLFITGEPVKQPNKDKATTLEEFYENATVFIEDDIAEFKHLCEVMQNDFNKTFGFGEYSESGK